MCQLIHSKGNSMKDEDIELNKSLKLEITPQ